MTAPGRSLPWWTWVVPAFVAHLGTHVSLSTLISPGVSAIYLPIPLGFVMACWWGPRVLAGVYVNAALSAGLWGIAARTAWPVVALPETVAVGAAWWLFTRAGGGRCWLPRLPDVVKFVFLAVIPAAFTNGIVLGAALLWSGDLARDAFRPAWADSIAG